MASHSVLVNVTRLNPSQTGRYSEGWVDLGVSNIPIRFNCLQTVIHLSSNHLIATRPRESNPRLFDRKCCYLLTATSKKLCDFHATLKLQAEWRLAGDICRWRHCRLAANHQKLFHPTSPHPTPPSRGIRQTVRQTDRQSDRVTEWDGVCVQVYRLTSLTNKIPPNEIHFQGLFKDIITLALSELYNSVEPLWYFHFQQHTSWK